MPQFSVIVPVLNEKEALPKLFDSLVHQTSEDFEVLLVDGGSTDGSLDLMKTACEKYVDFFLIEGKFATRFEALNRGLKSAEGEYVLFLPARDFITDETIENLSVFLSKNEKTPDVILFRNYIFGEGRMPRFSEVDDQLSPLPSIPKYDNLSLRTFYLGNKVYRRGYLENRKLLFGNENLYEDWLFIYKAFLYSRFTAGCPEAFCERRVNGSLEGFESRNQPTMENFKQFLSCFDEIYSLAAEMIEKDSETNVDGSESYLQEVLYRCVCLMIERFYQYLWYMDDETYAFFTREYNRRASLLNKEKMEKIKKLYGYLGAPMIYTDRQAVQAVFSLAVNFPKEEQFLPFLSSLYHQNFPFFEVFLPGRVAKNEELKPFLQFPNLHILDERDFFAAARKKSSGQSVLIVKDSEPLQESNLRELSESKVPAFLRQTVFAKIRKTSQMRVSLKEKGLNIS